MTSERQSAAGNTSGPQREQPLTSLPFARTVRWMIITEKALATAFLFIILATMGAQVVARYFFGAPFSWSEEISLLCLLWMTFMGAAFVMAEGRHITVDVYSSRLSRRGQLWLECFGHITVAGTCLLLLLSTVSFVWYVGKIGSPSLGIPRSCWYGAVVAGLLLISIHSIINLLQAVLTGRALGIEAASQTPADDEALHLNMEQGK